MSLNIDCHIERLEYNQDTRVEQIRFVEKEKRGVRGLIEVPRSLRSFEERTDIKIMVEERREKETPHKADLAFNATLFSEKRREGEEFPFIFTLSAGGFICRIESVVELPIFADREKDYFRIAVS